MTINSMASNQLQTSMIRLSTGQRINSARDDAAGLAISERMNAQIRGFEQGTRNVMDMQSLINTAEGGLSTINESLIRIRELSIQAMNDTWTQSDRENMQLEIDQLLDEIDHVTQRTEFNTMRLLDGSFSAEDGRGLHTAADSMGRGPTIHIGNMNSSMILGQGLPRFSVVDGNPDLDRLDNALSVVTRERSYLGAMSNRFDHTIASNQITNLNLAAANSRIRDADMALELMRLTQAQVMEQTQIQMQQRRQEQMQREGNLLSRL
jgi:flagellin